MTDPFIQVRSLRRSFTKGGAEVQVLRGLDLDVEEGAIVAIKGQSGSGKTTLLNILGGLDRAFQGSVRVASSYLERLGDGPVARFRNTTVGFVFQSFHLIDSMTCAENVMLPALFSRGRRLPGSRLEEVLGRVDLTGQAREPVRTMSGGQKQRAAIGRAILLAPSVLLCDEPTGNLDSETGAQILDLFTDLNHRDHMTIVLVTHEERVARIASRILTLQGGVLA